MSLTEKLKKRLATEKFISVAEYMSACLLDPEFGYYATRTPFGTKGDFITAPEISQIFGEIIGAWVASAWQSAGNPEASIVELGGGRGTLMHDALRATKNVPHFHARTQVVMVEASPALAKQQQEILRDAHPNTTTQTALLPLPERSCFFIANEFFDALPIEQTINGKLRRIVWDGAFKFENLGQGEIMERCPEAKAIMQQICGHLKAHGGALIVADYGYTKAAPGETLQAVKNHAYVDVLATPGEADLTAHVNFEALATIAKRHQLHTRLQTQGDFLHENAAEFRAAALCKGRDAGQQAEIVQGLERLMAPHQMGELFKVMTILA